MTADLTPRGAQKLESLARIDAARVEALIATKACADELRDLVDALQDGVDTGRLHRHPTALLTEDARAALARRKAADEALARAVAGAP